MLEFSEFSIIYKPTIEKISGPHKKILRTCSNLVQIVFNASKWHQIICSANRLMDPNTEVAINFVIDDGVGMNDYFVIDDRLYRRIQWDEVKSHGLPWSARHKFMPMFGETIKDSNSMRYHRNNKLVFYVIETEFTEEMKKLIAARM